MMGVKIVDIAERIYPAEKNAITLNRNKLASGNYFLVFKGIDNQKK